MNRGRGCKTTRSWRLSILLSLLVVCGRAWLCSSFGGPQTRKLLTLGLGTFVSFAPMAAPVLANAKQPALVEGVINVEKKDRPKVSDKVILVLVSNANDERKKVLAGAKIPLPASIGEESALFPLRFFMQSENLLRKLSREDFLSLGDFDQAIDVLICDGAVKGLACEKQFAKGAGVSRVVTVGDEKLRLPPLINVVVN